MIDNVRNMYLFDDKEEGPEGNEELLEVS